MRAEKVFHGKYCILKGENNRSFIYDHGPIATITFKPFLFDTNMLGTINVFYRNGEHHSWNTKYVDAYTSQFGIAVNNDGKMVFLQTWENGLFCFDARTGDQIWRTKSKRGVTNIFVLDDTVLCQQHDRALQLLDIHTGEVLVEKRVKSWGFTAIDHHHIVCQIKVRQWDLIEASSLQTIESFSSKVFTEGHEDYCVNKIERGEDGTIRVSGFKNVWDESERPAKMLPNLEFNTTISCDALIPKKNSIEEGE